MSAAFVSGVAALLREAWPQLSPTALADLLRRTAFRDLPGLAPGGPGPDPAWRPATGFGLADLYTARLEALEPGHSQVRRTAFVRGSDSLGASVWTARERDLDYVVIERAPDAGGAPGTFAPFDSSLAAGDSSLAGAGFHRYEFAWVLPPAERGRGSWWRAVAVEGIDRRTGPARRVTAPAGPTDAELEVTIVHDAYDHDVTAWLEAGGGAIRLDLPASADAESSEVLVGTSTVGTIAWTFRIGIPAGVATSWLPPSAEHPWHLRLTDAGFVNRRGRVTACRMVWHGHGGDVVRTADFLPRSTEEGGTVEVAIPGPVTDATSPTDTRRPWPNPVRAGGTVEFVLTHGDGDLVEIFDVHGRRIARLQSARGEAPRRLRWAVGAAVPGGLYLARTARHVTRVLVLPR